MTYVLTYDCRTFEKKTIRENEFYNEVKKISRKLLCILEKNILIFMNRGPLLKIEWRIRLVKW